MERPGGFYIIGLGERKDPGGFDPLYFEEHRGGEFMLPVFFSPGALERYAEGIAEDPGPETGAVAELGAGRYRAVHVEGESELLEVAAGLGVDCLVWDPAPGDANQQVYRLPR